MIEYSKLPDTIKVPCDGLGFGSFSVLIVPSDDVNAIETEADFYLIHSKYSVALFMFSAPMTTPEEDAETGYRNAPQYIPEYIESCFREC